MKPTASGNGSSEPSTSSSSAIAVRHGYIAHLIATDHSNEEIAALTNHSERSVIRLRSDPDVKIVVTAMRRDIDKRLIDAHIERQKAIDELKLQVTEGLLVGSIRNMELSHLTLNEQMVVGYHSSDKINAAKSVQQTATALVGRNGVAQTDDKPPLSVETMDRIAEGIVAMKKALAVNVLDVTEDK